MAITFDKLKTEFDKLEEKSESTINALKGYIDATNTEYDFPRDKPFYVADALIDFQAELRSDQESARKKEKEEEDKKKLAGQSDLMDKIKIIEEINKLGLNKANFWVIGSSSLVLRDIIDTANDIDLAMTEEEFLKLENQQEVLIESTLNTQDLSLFLL